MQALVRFSHIAAAGTFTTKLIHPLVAKALGRSVIEYSLGSLRYDLSKLIAKGLVQKLPRSRRYRLLRRGYQLCLVYLKAFDKLYAPLTAGVLRAFPGDAKLASTQSTPLDRLYSAVSKALDELVDAIGLKAA